MADWDSSAYQLVSERLQLRPLTTADGPALKAILADPEIMKLLLGDVSTAEGLEAEVPKWIDAPEDWQASGYGSWGIFGLASGEPGPLMGLAAADRPLLPSSAGPEIFYLLGRAHQGKGLAREAVVRLCRHLFEDLQVSALEASIFAEFNRGSVRLAERLGMRPVERVSLRHHGLDDDRLLGILRFDLWRVAQAKSEENLYETLAEAAFRSGQILAEGVGDDVKCRDALLSAASGAGKAEEELTTLLDRQLAAGRAAPGMVLFRMERSQFTP